MVVLMGGVAERESPTGFAIRDWRFVCFPSAELEAWILYMWEFLSMRMGCLLLCYLSYWGFGVGGVT